MNLAFSFLAISFPSSRETFFFGVLCHAALEGNPKLYSPNYQSVTISVALQKNLYRLETTSIAEISTTVLYKKIKMLGLGNLPS